MVYLLLMISTVSADKKFRASSYPYVSGDTFRSICTFIIDEEEIPFDPHMVKPGDVIFIKTDYLDHFFTKFHPYITASYILISHNSDYGLTEKYRDYLNDEKIGAWFAQNAGIIHPKLIPIPIGLANHYWPHGDINVVNNVVSDSSSNKSIYVYSNFNVSTNVSVRRPIYLLFKDKTYCYTVPVKSFSSYLYDLKCSKFVLSPPGNGMDCHRTWEALYMNAVPIVQSSTMNWMFQDLPVIIVEDWGHIDEEFLEKEYEKVKSKQGDMKKMYFDYWWNKIKAVQQQLQRRS